MHFAPGTSISLRVAPRPDRCSSRSVRSCRTWRLPRSIRARMSERPASGIAAIATLKGSRDIWSRDMRSRYMGSRSVGAALLAVAVAGAIAAPAIAPHSPDDQHRELLNAPPTIPHVIDDQGAWHAPFIYPWVLADRLEQRFEQDRTTRVALVWFSHGSLVRSEDDARAPLMLAGAAGGPAARPLGATGVCARRRNFHDRRRTVRRARRPRNRAVRARARIRRGRAVAGRGTPAPVAAAPAAGHVRRSRGPGNPADSGVHRRRGDAVVRGARFSGSGGELGPDAVRSVERAGARRFSLAAQSR